MPSVVQSWQTSDSNSLAISGVTAGNLLIMSWSHGSENAARPAGWTNISTHNNGGGWKQNNIVCAYKVADGTETIIQCSGGATRSSMVAAEIEGVDASGLIFTESASSSGTLAEVSLTAPADDTIAIVCCASDEGATGDWNQHLLVPTQSFSKIKQLSPSFGLEWSIASISQGPSLFANGVNVTMGYSWPNSFYHRVVGILIPPAVATPPTLTNADVSGITASQATPQVDIGF